jgi:flagellar M-ring protein FliF
MADRVKGIFGKLLEWWNHFTSKQKTIIVSVTAGVIVLFAILIYLLTRPQYELIASCETAKEASEVTELLDSNSFTYKTSTDATQVYVLKSQVSQANLLLGANEILTKDYTIDDVTEGGFSTTESDKQKRYKYLQQTQMETDLETNPAIKKANVQLSLPENNGTLIASDEEGFASVVLELESEIDDNTATALARFIATALGNESTENITIIDTNGNLLFAGEDALSSNGNASNQLEVKKQAENLVKQEVKTVLLGTNLYDDIAVAGNLVLDFSTYDNTTHNYTPADGQTQGVLSQEDTYQQDVTGATGGEPGTASNDDDTTYQLQDYSDSSSSTTEESRKYLPNEEVSRQTIPAGLIKYDESSISVSAKRLHVYREDDVEDQGLLVDMSWEEFKAANEEPVKLEVDEDLYSVVSKATGIAIDDIEIMAYEVPVFVDKDGFSVSATDIVQVVLIVLILAVLAFVVLRSMAGSKEAEPEEELSVESILQSTPTTELDDIELDDKSEARILIEKFVDENPDAVANLLRNWLQEDWG